MSKGTVFYRGPSQLDGKPIVGIATFKSLNRKTGDMIQTWILRDRIDPVRAVSNGGDSSICGKCHHRGDTDRTRTCYVNVGQAPLGIWRAWKRGVYDGTTVRDIPPDKPLRFGAYGDPVAVPIKAWRPFMDREIWTGYTHQWREKFAQPYRHFLMASCESSADMAEAAGMGWRAFTTIPHDEEIAPDGTIICPSVTHGTQCVDCGLCRGSIIEAPSISIPAHGTAKYHV